MMRVAIISATGKVKWFNATKGYGFIEADDGTGGLFVHVTALDKAGIETLTPGQRLIWYSSFRELVDGIGPRPA
jgi:cold shock protein